MAAGDAAKRIVAPLLPLNIAQGRFGEIYVAALCAQAGFGNDPTTRDEDVRAIDGTIHFDVGSCAYQVKCTTKDFGSKTETLAWPIEDRWRARWAKARMPVYFVVVRVKSQTDWVKHPTDLSTLLKAAAYWVKVDINTKRKSIVIPKAQRLTADSLRDWAVEVESDYTAKAS
ncbi:MAG TPA: DUF4365 domain-containing protein [Marmoricola sp.]|nr:DUF4365 domain-containing protein [Marmoricola sp.]